MRIPHQLFFSVLWIGLFSISLPTLADTKSGLLDSIRIEQENGKKIIIHAIEAKETYYSLGRKYRVAPKAIMAYNNNQALRINDLIRIPTNEAFIDETPVAPSPTTTPAPIPENVIQYKVGKGETLYAVSKRFNVSEDRIIAYNKLDGVSLKVNQVLLIPKGPVERQESRPVEPPLTRDIEEDDALETTPYIEQNRYGLRQMDERGIGVWLEGLNADGGKMLALHKTAPVGTVIKITNPMSGRSTFAKVVGKYTDSNLTRDAIIVISKAAASQVGILDKRFLVHISYGVPE